MILELYSRDGLPNSYLYRCFMIFLDDEGYLDSELIMVLKKIKDRYIAYLCQDKLSFNVEILCEVISIDKKIIMADYNKL